MSDIPSSRSRSRWYLYGAVVLGVSAAVWFFAFRAPPPRVRALQPAWAGTEYPLLIPVRAVTAQLQDLPVNLKAIGTVTPLNTVTVKSRVAGMLLRVGFEEGQRVKQGQVLAEIDPAPYRNRLKQTQGQVQQSEAQLQSARSDLERIRNLHAKNLVTNQELEVQQALVANREGALVAVQAQMDDAQLQLNYTRIEAPIDGRAGLRNIDAGNLMQVSDANGLVVLTQTQPISVRFTISEVDLQKVLDPFRSGEKMSVEAWDRSEKVLLATGELKTVDNQINIATGTVRLKAEFANEDDKLFPNQFVNIKMRVRTLEKTIVIPSAAVQFGSRGTYVYVVDDKNKARVVDVVLGPTDGTQQAVTKGLKGGDKVVLEGLDRLREGRGVVLSDGSPSAPASKP